jgi:hypothetical protein
MEDIRALDDKPKEDLNKLLKIEAGGAEPGKQQVREVFHIDVIEMITEHDAKDSPMTPGRLIEFDQDQEKSCDSQNFKKE